MRDLRAIALAPEQVSLSSVAGTPMDAVSDITSEAPVGYDRVFACQTGGGEATRKSHPTSRRARSPVASGDSEVSLADDAVHGPSVTYPSRPTPPEPGLSEAWARAEAALPEGWYIIGVRQDGGSDMPWRATAYREDPDLSWFQRHHRGTGPTPAAALLALAARLEGGTE